MNISCSICFETLKSTDALSAPSCGHVFHAACLDDWMERPDSWSCPQCWRYMVTIPGRIYLNFTETSDNSLTENMIAVHQNEVHKLQTKLVETEQIVEKLKIQITSLEADSQKMAAHANDLEKFRADHLNDTKIRTRKLLSTEKRCVQLEKSVEQNAAALKNERARRQELEKEIIELESQLAKWKRPLQDKLPVPHKAEKPKTPPSQKKDASKTKSEKKTRAPRAPLSDMNSNTENSNGTGYNLRRRL